MPKSLNHAILCHSKKKTYNVAALLMRNRQKKFGLILFTLYMMVFASWAWSENTESQDQTSKKLETAIFAGGCFWCMEPPFDKLAGVVSTVSGYTGGHVEDPSYKQVSAGGTGHFEAVEVTYDPAKIDYATLLNVFWHNVDPLTDDGQFCDKGDSYRTAIFYRNAEQRKLAEESKRALNVSGIFKQPVVTELLPTQTFYPAEDYHQNYYQENPLRYKYYRFACGRDNRLNELWGTSARKGGSLIPTVISTINE